MTVADFTEIVKQWKRMCRAHGSDYDKCEKCPLVECRICSFEISDIQDDEIERVEPVIMAWAAEHSEPVYPTWGEFIRQRYREECELYTEASLSHWFETTHIPADIAEKLGIEPKG